MKVAFNILLALLILWIIWLVIPHGSNEPSRNITSVQQPQNWEGARLIKTCKNYYSRPMAVVRNPQSDELFVSCIVDTTANGSTTGYVCRTNLYGEVADTLFFSSLTAPKGMVVLRDYLYVADINKVFRYNLLLDSVDNVYQLPMAKYLADIVSDSRGNIYISDSYVGCVYKIVGDSAQIFSSDTLCVNITGLCFDGNNLIAGAKNRILKIDTLGRIKTFAWVPHSVYGIRCYDEGKYLTTDFVGNTHITTSKETKLLIKKHEKAYSASIEYVSEQRLLYISTYTDNSIELYELGKL